MLRITAAALALFVLAGFPASSYAADNDIIGTVLKVEGTASLVPAGGAAAAPAVAQTHIHMHDVLQTGKQSKLFILFIDNTQFTLAPDTKLTVDEYIFDPANKDDNKARYDVLQGAFDYVSGMVAKKADPDVKIETPFGAVGVRGTNFWGGHTGGHSYGFHVSEGQIGVGNGGGNVVVNQGQGTIIPGPGQPPGPPAPWGDDLLAMIGETTGMNGLGGLISGQQGHNNQLLHNWLKHHHHHTQTGDDGPDPRDNDLPQDETGEPNFIPFAPPGGLPSGGN